MTDEQIEWAIAKARQCRRTLGEINPRYFARICNTARLRFGPELAPVDGLDALLAELDGHDVARTQPHEPQPTWSPPPRRRPRPSLAAGWRRWVRPVLRGLDAAIGGER